MDRNFILLILKDPVNPVQGFYFKTATTSTSIRASLGKDQFLHGFRPPKYFANVLPAGFCVAIETKIINNADTITIGTTGMNP